MAGPDAGQGPEKGPGGTGALAASTRRRLSMVEFGVLAGLVVVLAVGVGGLVASMTGGEDPPAEAPLPATPAPIVAAAPQVVAPPPPASSPSPVAVAPPAVATTARPETSAPVPAAEPPAPPPEPAVVAVLPPPAAPEPVNPGGSAFPRPDPRVVPVANCMAPYLTARQEYEREMAAIRDAPASETHGEACRNARRLLALMTSHAKRTMHCMGMMQEPGFVEDFWQRLGQISGSVVRDCAGVR